MSVRVTLFGALRVEGPLGVLDAGGFPSRKARQVFELLALAGGESVAKERLVDDIWGERLPADPVGAVEQAVSVLRRALASVVDAPLVRTRGDRYSLDVDVAAVDVAEFDAAIARAAGAPSLARREPHLRDAVRIAVAPLLADERRTWWVDRERERRRQDSERAWRDLAFLAAARGDHHAALSAAGEARAMTLDVADELRQIEVDALAVLGRVDEAHRALAGLERDIAAERRPPRIDLDALRSRVALPTALLAARTELEPMSEPSFVGRDDVLGVIEAWWQSPGSLGLVAAPAGTGRSRLLAEVAHRAREQVTVVEVACAPAERAVPMLVAARVVRALARAAGARMPAPDDRAVALFTRVTPWIERCGPVVIVVDDAHRADRESLAFLSALVDARAGVHVVASCRSALAGELEESLGAAHLQRVELGPWSRDDVLVIADADDLLARRLQDETAGHPATVLACIDAARRGGALDARGIAAVTARLDELPIAVRMVLEAAAQLRSPTIAAVARRIRRPRDEVAVALALAAERGVVQVDGDRVDVIPAILRRCVVARING